MDINLGYYPPVNKLVNYMGLYDLSQDDIAKGIGVTQGAISHWITGRRIISAEEALRLCKYTKWVLTPHDLRPDIWPNKTDALPKAAA